LFDRPPQRWHVLNNRLLYTDWLWAILPHFALRASRGKRMIGIDLFAMSDFTHLHVHSHYSLLDGLGKIKPMLQQAKELGMDSLALTDHGAMYGAIDFLQAAEEVGMRPILGVEAYLAPLGHTQKRGKIDANPCHITLLAQNKAGYHNLIKLTTAAHLQGYYYKPRIDYDLLAAHSEGLIILSGCLNSALSRAIVEGQREKAEKILTWHLDVFGRERFYLEVQHHPTLTEQTKVNEALFRYSKTFKLGLVATADSHYIHAEDAEAHDVLLCVQTGRQVQEKDRMCMLGEDFSLKSPTEMKQLWREHPEAIDNTQKIAEACHFELEFGVNRLPRYPLPSGVTPEQHLRSQCEAKLATRYEPEVLRAARERLEYELSIISKTGFAPYFLIVADFVNEAKRRGILVGPGRGSAAGSIVSYLTGITGLDPLHYNLLFERFLNPDRVSMPDIDLDFADDRRDEIIEYVRDKYGHDHVAQIITFGTMAARAAVRDAGRALGYPYAFCDTIAKAIPPFMNFEQALKESAELQAHYEGDGQAKRLIDTAKKLEGVCRHASTHAAGVVITDEPLTNHVPLQLTSTTKGARDTIVTQYSMNHVEALGLLKMDFLGLKNLTIIQDTLQRIAAREGRHTLDITALPLDDAATYTLLQEGSTIGVFQLESAGMRRWLRELAPTEFEDIISILALYRPGPMDSIPDFVAAKHGRKKITYLHPLLKPILEKTYGVIVTQDQVLQIARDFAGFTYGEADILRKAVGKKIKKLLLEQRKKFIAGAIDTKGIEKARATQVWDFIEPFARYGFNRAHAACYAMIAYQTAYLKANFPAEFMAALLTSDEGNVERQAIEVAEAVRSNLRVLPPDINESGEDFTVVMHEGHSAIRFGLSAIKNVGHQAVAAVIGEREQRGAYVDLFDLFRRIHASGFNRKAVESLARAGAFDSLAERALILANAEALLTFSRNLHKQTEPGQVGLFGQAAGPALPAARVTLREVPAASKDERLAWEKELLGLYVSEHPLQELGQELADIATPIADVVALKQRTSSGKVRVAGIVTRLTKITTKSGQPMLFVQLEDLTGKIETLVFPALLTKTSEHWADGKRVLIEGSLSDKDGEAKVLADNVWPLTAQTLSDLRQRAPDRPAARLVLRLPSGWGREQLQGLHAVLVKYHQRDAGSLPVVLLVRENNHLKEISTKFHLPARDDVREELTQLVGEGSLSAP